MSTILPQSAGYGVVLGVGFFFTALMATISFIQVRRIRCCIIYYNFDVLEPIYAFLAEID